MQFSIWAVTVVLSLLITPLKANSVVNVASNYVGTTIASRRAIAVSKAEFGVFRVDKNGKTTFIPTTKVHLEEGKKYGWRIQMKDYKGELTWREVIRLPQRPESWGTDNGENFSIEENGTEGVTTRTQLTKDGVIRNSWTMVSGDPLGKHMIDVYVDERRIASFEFEVIPSLKRVDRSRTPRL